MIAINVFDTPVVLHHCHDKEIYANSSIKQSVEFVFSLDEVRSNVDQSQIGNGFSTCGLYNKFPLTSMVGSENLTEWVARKILESATHFGFDNVSKVEFTRTWANVIYLNCEGTCHTHPNTVDGVAILYHKVPDKGSELAFIKNGIVNTKIEQYNESDVFKQRVLTGDMIIHKPSIPHAVTKHYSQKPRICFIYEFKYH